MQALNVCDFVKTPKIMDGCNDLPVYCTGLYWKLTIQYLNSEYRSELEPTNQRTGIFHVRCHLNFAGLVSLLHVKLFAKIFPILVQRLSTK